MQSGLLIAKPNTSSRIYIINQIYRRPWRSNTKFSVLIIWSLTQPFPSLEKMCSFQNIAAVIAVEAIMKKNLIIAVKTWHQSKQFLMEWSPLSSQQLLRTWWEQGLVTNSIHQPLSSSPQAQFGDAIPRSSLTLASWCKK